MLDHDSDFRALPLGSSRPGLLRSLGLIASSIALVCAASTGNKALDDKIAATDLTNADAVFELGQWCDQNKLTAKSRQYYNDVLKIDPDHDGARAALGFVRVGTRWVPKAFAPPTPATVQPTPGSTGPGGGQRTASGKGPTAAEMKWDLTVPVDPEPANTWINTHIETTNTAGNDSSNMDSAVRTIIRDDNWPLAYPRLCKRLMDGTQRDLYGPSEMVRILFTTGRGQQAREFFPFLVKASEKCTDIEDLTYFLMVAQLVKDKRLIPRLIELLDHTDKRVKDGAAEAAGAITSLPAKNLAASRVREWWDLNWNISEEQILREQLASPEPAVQLEACLRLYESRDKAIVPVLIRLMRINDVPINRKAHLLIERIADSRAYDPTLPAAEKAKQVDRIEKWWNAEGLRWVWIEDLNKSPVARASATDPHIAWVRDLGDSSSAKIAQAEASLTSAGTKAVPALLSGMADANALLRRKSHDILKGITKQDFGYDPRAADAERAAAIAKWKEWAEAQGLMGGAAGSASAAP